MAQWNLNCVYLLFFITQIMFLIHVCQTTGDFSDDDYYDFGQEDFPKADPHHGTLDSVHSNKLNHEKLHDYLFGIQSQVLSNNDVLTVKPRKPTTTRLTKNTATQFTVTQAESQQGDPQSDQPSNSENWRTQTIPQDEASTKNFWPKSVPTEGPRRPVDSSASSAIGKPPNLPEPFDGQMQTWNCHFRANQDCGIVNDLAVGKYFNLESHNFFRNFQWKSWYLLMNASTVPDDAVGARLITPYFNTGNVSQGCLSIQYITTGDAVARVSLYQQDKGNYCLWMSEPASHTSPDVPANYQMDFTVDLFRGSPRYFLELYIDTHRPGARESVFALAHLRLAYRPCFKDNTNHCRPVPKPNDQDIVMP